MNSTELVLSLANSEPISAVATTPSQQRFLQFSLQGNDPALLPVEYIAEVLRLPIGEVLPVPHMPSFVLGIYNWRGEIIWLVDFDRLVGHPIGFCCTTQAIKGMIIVLEVERFFGLVVSQIDDIGWHDPAQLCPPSGQLFSPKLLPFVQGYFSSGITVLDPVAIAKSFSVLA